MRPGRNHATVENPCYDAHNPAISPNRSFRSSYNFRYTGYSFSYCVTSFLFGVVLMGLTTFGKYSTDLTFPFYKQIHPDFLIARFSSKKAISRNNGFLDGACADP